MNGIYFRGNICSEKNFAGLSLNNTLTVSTSTPFQKELCIQQCFRLNCGVFYDKIFLLVIKIFCKSNMTFPRCVTLIHREMPLHVSVKLKICNFCNNHCISKQLTFYTEPIALIKILIYSPFTFNVKSTERNK